MKNQQPISVVVTVRNEANSIVEFLHSLATQTRHPDEVVIVDGGSKDETVDRIRSCGDLRICLREEPCNIARGRNIGIEHARYDAIAVTDAGCFLAPDWLANISAGLDNADVAVGNYRPRINSLFDACQYSLTSLFGSDTALEHFTISSRSLAFRRSVWQDVGGYPEWLDYSEDAYFHDQLKRHGYRIAFRPDAVVEWELRKTVRDIFIQFFRYMRGEAIGLRHTARNTLRYLTYTSAGLCACFCFRHPAVLLPLAFGLALYLSAPLRNFRRLGVYRLGCRATVYIAAMLVCVDCAKMAGYASGLLAVIKARHEYHTTAPTVSHPGPGLSKYRSLSR